MEERKGTKRMEWNRKKKRGENSNVGKAEKLCPSSVLELT